VTRAARGGHREITGTAIEDRLRVLDN